MHSLLSKADTRLLPMALVTAIPAKMCWETIRRAARRRAYRAGPGLPDGGVLSSAGCTLRR